MGVVYEAYDPSLDREVALKTIHPAFAVSPPDRAAFERRFFAEARIAACLSHPGIVTVHDVGRDSRTGVLYFALEHLKGQTLAEKIKGGPLPWREALRMVRGVAEALHYAHSHKVVHLDVKPANVMVLPSGEPKLMDFGIARIETARLKLTASGQVFGTPLYMSPEQALGQKADGRADLFSLGAILYTLLTGRLAFEANNITAILARVIREDPVLPTRLVPTLPREVDYVVARALAKSPAARYPDGQTLIEDIEDVLGGRPPRHRSAWTPSGSAGEIAIASALPVEGLEPLDLEPLLDEQPPPAAPRPAANLEAEIQTLVSASSAARATRPPAPAAPPLHPLRPEAAAAARRHEERPSPGRLLFRSAAGGLVLVVLGVLSVLLVTRSRKAETPKATPVAATAASGPVPAPSPSLVSNPSARPISGPSPGPVSGPPAAGSSPEPEAPRAKLPETAKAQSARLTVDLEHPLKTGRISIWADDELIFKETLDSRVTKKILALKLRKGPAGDGGAEPGQAPDSRPGDLGRQREDRGDLWDVQTRRHPPAGDPGGPPAEGPLARLALSAISSAPPRRSDRVRLLPPGREPHPTHSPAHGQRGDTRTTRSSTNATQRRRPAF